MNERAIGLVAIGASAGGIEAFRQFFQKMPADSGLAFVVVLHLAPEHKSMLPQILSRWTAMQMREARNGSAIEPNHVLILPPGTIAELHDGHLSLREVVLDLPRHLAPIDALFDSVAASLGEDAIGVILSGTGHDGVLGLKAIKARGGLTLAQASDGNGPEYPGMPDSAVAAGVVDFHVPVEEMPGHILAARQIRQATATAPDPASEDTDRIRLALCDILRSRLGHDFSQYKQQTFMRRVQRRMQVLRLTLYEDYVRLLEADREQVTLLFRDLLIGVTSFFRDPETFEALAKDVIPGLFNGKDAVEGVRIWVPGCATGEEAYSLAILLREYTATLSAVPKIQIFASDIDEAAIATARSGRYPATLLDGVSQERRNRFFIQEPDGYTVRQEVRELCTFSAHSLIRDPPFSRIDLISCRNLLIYMDNSLQDRVIPIFHYALMPRGILVLGSSETIARHEALFTPLDRARRIFVRRDGPSLLPGVYRLQTDDPKSIPEAGVGDRTDPKTVWAKAVAFANRRVLDRFSPPFVVATAAGKIVHFSSHVGRFLEPAPSSPSTNLFEMARPGWALELRAALRRSAETGRPVEQLRPVVSVGGEEERTVKLVVEPLPGGDTEVLYMVAFVDGDEPRPPGQPAVASVVPAINETVADLERENRDLRDQLQSIAEEHATAMEELRSSNEELQSVNEELQSTNEELETSREEIQSINEELNTVNSQLSSRVEQLNRSNGDLRNLFDSTKVATVFLDPFMIIRSFTPEIARIYNLIPGDVGRPLTDIVSQLNYTTLREDVRTVLRTLQPMERRVERLDHSSHYLMRLLPYRGPDNAVDGSLITFVDVTSMVVAEQHQKLLVDELNHRVKNMLAVVISLTTNTVRRSASLEAFQEVFLGRIHALTVAYTLLSRDAWAPVPVREVLMEQLRPFLAGEQSNVGLNGPLVLLRPRVALALGMAIHELTTNAVKYGALSVVTGRVGIEWTVEVKNDAKQLVLTWTERGGPTVQKPEQLGFGMTLIERAFAHDVRGRADVEFARSGVVATLSAPLQVDPPKEKP